HRGGEKAPAWEHATLKVGHERLAQCMQPANTRGRGQTRLDDLRYVPRAALLDGGHLEVLLGSEVGEQAALAHGQLGGEPADGQPVEAVDGGHVGGCREDGLPGPGSMARGSRHTPILARSFVLSSRYE